MGANEKEHLNERKKRHDTKTEIANSSINKIELNCDGTRKE